MADEPLELTQLSRSEIDGKLTNKIFADKAIVYGRGNYSLDGGTEWFHVTTVPQLLVCPKGHITLGKIDSIKAWECTVVVVSKHCIAIGGLTIETANSEKEYTAP